MISVIIPTYKPADYIIECLDSVCCQTISPDRYEVIVVLNGCCEPYYSMLKNYVSEHREVNFRLLQTDVPGVSNARNLGLDKAVGDYITFLDDDDYLSPRYLEVLREVSDEETIGLSKVYDFVDGSKDEVPSAKNSLYARLSPLGPCHYTQARQYFSGPVMKLFHRSIIGSRRFDTRLKNGEDSVYMFLLSDRFSNVCFATADCIYYRRYRRNSAISNKGFLYSAHNLCYKLFSYTKIYLSNPRGYSFSFYVTRLLGSVKYLFRKNMAG